MKSFDVVVDIYSKYSSNLITLFSGANLKISKHKWYTSFLYNKTFKDDTIKKTNAGLAIENRLRLLDPLQIKPNPVKPKIYLTEREIENAKTKLKEYGIDLSKPLYMISVLGSSLNKTLPFKTMARVINFLAEQTQGQILFNYIPNQLNEAETIYNLCNESSKKHIYFDLFGKSLREFLALTSQCNALVGNEGGATNMAKALNIPAFTIFSPWINKDAWNMFDNGSSHVSIHLEDFKPELYAGKNYKRLKSKATELYNELTFEFIEPHLKTFLNYN